MLEDEINDESDIETFVVGGDDYAILVLLLIFCHLRSASIKNPP